METTPETSHQNLSPDLGPLGRLVRVFYAPAETFEAVQTRHSWHDWFIPTLITAIVMTVAVQITMPLVIETQQKAIAQQMRDSDLSDQQRAQQQEMIGKMEGFTSAATLVMTPVSMFLMLFILAAILLLVGRFVLGGDINYGQALAIQGYATLIQVVQAVVLTPIRLEKESMMLLLGPGLFLSEQALTGFGGRLLGMIDIFALWQVGIAAVGLSILTPASFGKSLAAMLVLWAIYLLIAAGVSGLVPGV